MQQVADALKFAPQKWFPMHVSSVGCEIGWKWERNFSLPFWIAVTAAAAGTRSQLINSVAKENQFLALYRKVIMQIVVLLISSMT